MTGGVLPAVTGGAGADRVPGQGLTRRQGLRLLGAGALVLAGAAAAGCSPRPSAPAGPVPPSAGAAPTTGRVVDARLSAVVSEVDIGGRVVQTWTYGGELPGPALRLRAGDRLRVRVDNELPEATSVHWHGPAVRNGVDGVPGVSTPEIAAGESVGYEFVVPTPGTHWLHPHSGLQLDRGLHAPLVVEDPDDPGDVDEEVVVVLDDWTDGLDLTPEEVLAALEQRGGTGMGPGGMGPGRGMSDGGQVGTWDYPTYLANGRVSAAPRAVSLPPGARVRLRLVNAAADTAFRVAVAGHWLTLTHSDGYPVEPVEARAVLLAMGERVDAVVTLDRRGPGVVPLVAAADGKPGSTRLLLRSSPVAVSPPTELRPDELRDGPALPAELRAAEAARLPGRDPDQVLDVLLGGGHGRYVWSVNGHRYPDGPPLRVSPGQRVRLRVRNGTHLAHPIHVHGHTPQVARRRGNGARKDTALVAPMGRLDLDLDADNPGRWLVHCHNAYHAATGMMIRLDYDE